MRSLVLGTAGHIDHGKSALVEALTGVHPDRLEEEKRRGITIDLGFADLELGEDRLLAIVDVPGHERFVRHMVAGAAGIDAVLLVVAADDGVRPQTREHLDICRLLGVAHGVVALTKVDLVDPDVREVALLETREFVRGSFLENATIVPVSARTGAGLETLKAALSALFDRAEPRVSGGAPRLPIDRSFVLRGFGTVVTGTLYAGTLEEKQEVEILPGGRRARIRGLQIHGRPVRSVRSGTRVAVNLQGVETDEAPRGSTVTIPGALGSTTEVWARVRFLSSAPEALRERGGAIRFHHGTCERSGRLRVLRRGTASEADAEIRLDEETILLPGDRFILRRPRPLDTVAGGEIVDPHPPRGAARARARREGLGTAAGGDLVRDRVARAASSGADPAEIAQALGFARDELEPRLAELERSNAVVRRGSRVFDRAVWDRVEARALAILESFHRAEPLQPGMRREDLRAAADRGLPLDAWRDMLDRLAGRGAIRLEGEKVALAEHRVVLSGGDLEVANRIEARFRDAGLDPPDPKVVVAENGDPAARRVLETLVDRGRLVRIRDGRIFHAEPLAELRVKVADYGRRSRTIDVAAFKDLAGVTRKNAIPLLEQLDAERRTRRVGNIREILGNGAA